MSKSDLEIRRSTATLSIRGESILLPNGHRVDYGPAITPAGAGMIALVILVGLALGYGVYALGSRREATPSSHEIDDILAGVIDMESRSSAARATR